MVREPILGLESMMALIEPDFVHRIYTVGTAVRVDASDSGLTSADILRSSDKPQVHTHSPHMLHHTLTHFNFRKVWFEKALRRAAPQ